MAMKTKAIVKAEKLWAEGVKVKDIAEMCGVKVFELMNYAVENRDRFPRRKVCTRLTDEQKRQIDELREQGYGYYAIARIVGCSVSTVRRLRGV